MNAEFDSKPIYGDINKYIKTKRRTYEDKIKGVFHNN